MNLISRPHRKPGRILGSVLSAGLLVWMLGVACSPALAAVQVDQTPLIIQKSLPPNITLMLDDSGSMTWNFMPDFSYLNNNGNNDALINASNNGVYYNPAITYLPPPMANGTSYAAATGLTSAWVDGFASSPTAVDLTNYDGRYEYYDCGGVCPGSAINFSASNSVTTPSSATYSGVTQNRCDNYYWNQPGATGETYTPASGNKPSTCVIAYNASTTYNYFQYSTGAAAGPYTVSYVAASDCGGKTNCVLASDTSGKAAPAGVAAGQNIANWFSYYHTRILMAKSGLMNSFLGVDANFRIGFGSIDGGRNNNYSNLPASRYSYADAYNGGSNYIANVTPFGDGSAAGDQKNALWSWITAATAGGGTPLRQALDAVGRYYQTAQPWQAMSSDPVPAGTTTELACRQSYTILTTDGFWNESFSGVGNADGSNGTPVSGANGQKYTYTAAAPYSDTYSNTLADVAMKYWMTDLRPSTANEVPTSAEDPAFWQHMTTFTLGLGFTPQGIKPTGTTVKQIFDWANGGTAISNFSWPQPSSNSINNIADLAHAAVNGHGGFYSATSPQAFASGLKDALKRAAERVGTGASLAANSTQLKTGTVAYQANYYTAKWKGDLKALAVNPNTGAIAATPTWTAVGSLPSAASRNIWTYNPAASGRTAAYVAFQNGSASTPPALSVAQLSALGGTAAAQANMVNYLRGDATLEQKNGGNLRNRDTPLGDIVDSQPVYVGAPDSNLFANETFTGSSTYLAYASGTTDNQGNFTPSIAASRAGLIYVAANDGMLHGFDATTGAEKFAYIPAAALTTGSAGGLVGLSQLSSPDYGTTTSAPHQYFNDGELTVADVYMGSAWKSVLVGTSGRGLAKAVYAFDITDPTAIKFLWERSAGDGKTNSNYIGQMSGKPVIAQTADGTWSVLLGNGYNSSAGVSALLQFDLASGSLSVHATTDTTADNGLAAPGVWMGLANNGVSTVAYAGDLRGNVWSFTLNTGSGTSTSTPSSTGSLLFVAKDGSGNLQPITGGVLVGKDPANGNTWVFFGTGQYLGTLDLTSTATQSWYGLIVQTTNATNSPAITSSMTRAANLVQRSIVAQTTGNPGATPPVSPARAVTPAPTSSDMTGQSGWYMDLLSPTGTNGAPVAQGERMVTSNQFQGNLLLGTTRIPQASDVCNPSGSGWIMAINPFTGTSPSGNFFDLNGDGLVNASDTVTVNGKSYAAAGIGFNSLPNNPIFVGGSMLVSFDNGSNSSITTAGSTGMMQRVSWRELVNP